MRARPDLDALLAELVACGEVSAAVGIVATASARLWCGAAGWSGPERERAATIGTRFDLASLTKPWTATLGLALDARGELPLDLRLGAIFERVHERLARRTLRDLLAHRSGLQAWAPLAARCANAAEVERLLLSGELLGAERGTYSDLGYILFGLAAERVRGVRLAALLSSKVLHEVGATATGPGVPGDATIAGCELDGSREAELAAAAGWEVEPVPASPPGVVQDGNARFLGGLAGHAGLFGTADDLVALGRVWLAGRAPLDPDRVASALAGRGEYACGWARRRVRGSAGPALSAAAFGHTGFTGGSLWIDPRTDRISVLLAHRRSVRCEMNPWRRRFHSLASAL